TRVAHAHPAGRGRITGAHAGHARDVRLAADVAVPFVVARTHPTSLPPKCLWDDEPVPESRRLRAPNWLEIKGLAVAPVANTLGCSYHLARAKSTAYAKKHHQPGARATGLGIPEPHVLAKLG